MLATAEFAPTRRRVPRLAHEPRGEAFSRYQRHPGAQRYRLLSALLSFLVEPHRLAGVPVLELGCRAAQGRPYLPAAIDYTGVEHHTRLLGVAARWRPEVRTARRPYWWTPDALPEWRARAGVVLYDRLGVLRREEPQPTAPAIIAAAATACKPTGAFLTTAPCELRSGLGALLGVRFRRVSVLSGNRVSLVAVAFDPVH